MFSIQQFFKRKYKFFKRKYRFFKRKFAQLNNFFPFLSSEQRDWSYHDGKKLHIFYANHLHSGLYQVTAQSKYFGDSVARFRIDVVEGECTKLYFLNRSTNEPPCNYNFNLHPLAILPYTIDK